MGKDTGCSLFSLLGTGSTVMCGNYPARMVVTWDGGITLNLYAEDGGRFTFLGTLTMRKVPNSHAVARAASEQFLEEFISKVDQEAIG